VTVYKYVPVTDVDRKHLNRRECFQQHRDAKFNQFFPACEGDEGSSRHSDRNIRVTCTIIRHRQILGDSLNIVIFAPPLRLVLKTQNIDHPGYY